MIRLNRSSPPPPPPPRGLPVLMRDVIVASIALLLGVVLSGIGYLFREEPAKLNETRGRTEFNRLRIERNESDIRDIRADIRRIIETMRTHRHQ